MSPFFLTALPSTSTTTTTLKPTKCKYSLKYYSYSVLFAHLCFVCLREKPKTRRIRSLEEKLKMPFLCSERRVKIIANRIRLLYHTIYLSLALSFDFPVTVLVFYDSKNSESRIKETLFPMYFP